MLPQSTPGNGTQLIAYTELLGLSDESVMQELVAGNTDAFLVVFKRYHRLVYVVAPNVHVQVFIADRIVDQIAEGVDLVFKIGEQLKDSSLVARRILTYRHQLVASPVYLAKCNAPKTPQDLLDHRLLAFSFWTPENSWNFAQANGKKKETLTFRPFLSMNDYAGLATALVAGTGIGDLPPLVQPELLRAGRLVEVMPGWHFSIFHLWVVHLGNRYITRPVRVFKEFATQMAPTLFPALPT